MAVRELRAKLVRIDVLTPLCVRRRCCVPAVVLVSVGVTPDP